MWILPLVGYLGILVGFIFLTLSIASGLYYLSELVEEHTVAAKRLLTYLVYFVIGTLALLCLVDRLPVTLTLLSIGSHIVYATNLRRFPVVQIQDPLFILSCALVLINHYLWFQNFTHPSQHVPPRNSYDYYNAPPPPTFAEISAFFGICVWLIPFALFVSLSASDNVLPTMSTSGIDNNRVDMGKNRGIPKQVFDAVSKWITVNGETIGLWKGERSRGGEVLGSWNAKNQ